MAAPRVRRQAPPWRPRLCDSSDTDSNPALHPTGPAPNTSTGRAGPPPRHSIRWSSTISKRFSPKPPRTTVWATVSLYGWRRTCEPYLRCGILAHGFARLRCEDCGHERLLPFSCKFRGVCPSCNTRRMAEVAAHITDHVLPHLPRPPMGAEPSEAAASLPTPQPKDRRRRPADLHPGRPSRLSASRARTEQASKGCSDTVLDHLSRWNTSTHQAASFPSPHPSAGSFIGYPSRRPTAAPSSCSLRSNSSSGSLASSRPRASIATDITGSSDTSSCPTAPPISPAHGPPQGDLRLDQTLAFDPSEAEPIPESVFDQCAAPRVRRLSVCPHCPPGQVEPFGHLDPPG